MKYYKIMIGVSLLKSYYITSVSCPASSQSLCTFAIRNVIELVILVDLL